MMVNQMDQALKAMPWLEIKPTLESFVLTMELVKIRNWAKAQNAKVRGIK